MRQSAFALVGDLARSCWDQVRPALPALLELARAQLDTAHVTQANMPACNNACWSLGQPPPPPLVYQTAAPDL